MKLAKRIIAVVGAPALLAGFMLAGSAAASAKTPKPAPLPYSVAVTANVQLGTTTATVTSTSCTLTANGNKSYPCFLSGSAVDGADGWTGNFAIVGTGKGNFGPITLSLAQATDTCADGTAVVVPAGPASENATGTLKTSTLTGPTTATIKATVKIGPNVNGCPVDDGGGAS